MSFVEQTSRVQNDSRFATHHPRRITSCKHLRLETSRHSAYFGEDQRPIAPVLKSVASAPGIGPYQESLLLSIPQPENLLPMRFLVLDRNFDHRACHRWQDNVNKQEGSIPRQPVADGPPKVHQGR
jgi:hypothetical protein